MYIAIVYVFIHIQDSYELEVLWLITPMPKVPAKMCISSYSHTLSYLGTAPLSRQKAYSERLLERLTQNGQRNKTPQTQPRAYIQLTEKEKPRCL